MDNNQFNNQQNGQEKALDRFARNLNELAEKGKLDPVIGRDEFAFLSKLVEVSRKPVERLLLSVLLIVKLVVIHCFFSFLLFCLRYIKKQSKRWNRKF